MSFYSLSMHPNQFVENFQIQIAEGLHPVWDLVERRLRRTLIDVAQHPVWAVDEPPSSQIRRTDAGRALVLGPVARTQTAHEQMTLKHLSQVYISLMMLLIALFLIVEKKIRKPKAFFFIKKTMP